MDRICGAKHGKYISKNPLKKYVIRKFLDEVNALVAAMQPKSILDVGCGAGIIIGSISAKLPGVSIVGIDIDKNSLNYARKFNPDHRYIESSIYEYNTEAKYDLVLCCEVLEHLDQPEKAMGRIKSLSDRYMLLSVPYEPWFRICNLIGLNNLSRLGNTPGHINHWNTKSIGKLLSPYFSNLNLKVCFPWILAWGEKSFKLDKLPSSKHIV